MHLKHCLFGLSTIALTLPFAANVAAQAIPASAPPAVRAAGPRFSGTAMDAHVRFLASDLLEGRGPGTRGDDLAMQYIASQFQAFGLAPAGDDGTYIQKVPLIGIRTIPEQTTLSFTRNGASVLGPLKHEDEWVGQDQTQVPNDVLDSEVIFVGHGVEAPEYRWDDYKGLDTKGKTLVMLVDDPPASAAEPDLFKGKTRTYYGRWTYKYEMGAAKDAAAVLLIHTTDAAGYGWPVVRNSWGAENSFMKLGPGQNALKLAGWITEDVAARLFSAAGYDLATLTRAAASRDFKPVDLGVKLSGNITTTIRPFDSGNVVGKVVGSDPTLAAQAVLYTAHHDHLGIGKADDRGDRIYNGAIDNGSGCAILLDLARIWATTMPRPRRSILFAAVAAEEQGLLGSAYYGAHPTFPAGRIALNINYDAIPEIGRVSDVVINGAERTTFYPTAEQVTSAMGITIVPDQEPEQGHYYRSDHFSLGKVGIPAFSVEAGQTVIGKPAGFGKARSDDYRAHHYHQPSDEISNDWDWSTGVEMAQLGFWLGWEAANADVLPTWKPGDEFRAARDRSFAAVH